MKLEKLLLSSTIGSLVFHCCLIRFCYPRQSAFTCSKLTIGGSGLWYTKSMSLPSTILGWDAAKDMGESEHWRGSWCRLWGNLDRWELLYLCLIGDRLAEYLPSFLTCSIEVLWAAINLFKVFPRLKYSFPSFVIYFLLNIVFLKIVLGWGRWWCKTIAHPIYICTNLDNSNFNLSLLWCIFMYTGFFTKFCSW